MALGMMCIPMGDATGKVMTTSYGVTPFFIAWTRFILGALLVLPFLRSRHIDPRMFLDWRIYLRAGLIIGAISSILTALQTTSLATTFGAFFIGPIISYFLAAWLLKEPITIGRTLLLLLGFGGVLLVVKPGFGMIAGTGFAVMAGLCYGGFLVANRWLNDAASPRALLFSQFIIGVVVMAPLGIADIPSFSWNLTALVIASAVFSMMGNLLLILACQKVEASRLAPIVYFQLVSATITGFVVFGDVPDVITLGGLGLLIASGLASVLLRPQQVK
ncbi:MAG: hypothetical protein COB78_02690 [Hyphomicrobiales bacterium]|nr:MAG: hypothetical protein COB78_02690 [Hyphomicrobiales bacterium]